MICRDFLEHKGWRKKHPLGPVTWDAWCSNCGFRLEDKKFGEGEGLYIEGDGRKLKQYRKLIHVDGEIFRSDDHEMLCSECA